VRQKIDHGLEDVEASALRRKEIRRLLDPTHLLKLPRIQTALAALGKRIAVRLVDEAA